ncbi:hypothetical protein BLNAU_25122 [Blattamonas nauphoetae]|uniref:Uncharacterized protein n=1 Tax=Blattamonas nauphoetae TaxID=2049346 RepID=A0ABQ9WMH4_9EUKA|nr:hypothetical protein BLNAU_25122 [Blattamonas nauphoetae]
MDCNRATFPGRKYSSMRIGVQRAHPTASHSTRPPHHSPLSDHSNPNQVHSFVGLVSSNGKSVYVGSVPASTVAFRELTRTSPNANCSAKLTSNTDYTKSNQTTCALFKLSSTLVARVSRFANHHSLHLHCKHSIHPHSRHVSQHSIHLSFCQQNCRSSLLNCVELCSSQQAPLPNSPNTRPSFSMHNTERCVDQCYQKSEGCVLDCGKSEMTECERTCITKLTQCTAGDSGRQREKWREEGGKRGDGMSIMFSQFKIGHEAKATKGCVLAAGVFDVQSTTKGHFSLAASTTARQHAQTVFTILRRLQVDPLGVIVVEAVNDGMQADGRFELKGRCAWTFWERRCLNIVSGVMGLPLPSVSVKKDRVEEKMKGFFEIGALSAKISTQQALKKMLRKTNDILFAFALPSPQLKKKSNVRHDRKKQSVGRRAVGPTAAHP